MLGTVFASAQTDVDMFVALGRARITPDEVRRVFQTSLQTPTSKMSVKYTCYHIHALERPQYETNS
jgi:hypothetical protein